VNGAPLRVHSIPARPCVSAESVPHHPQTGPELVLIVTVADAVNPRSLYLPQPGFPAIGQREPQMNSGCFSRDEGFPHRFLAHRPLASLYSDLRCKHRPRPLRAGTRYLTGWLFELHAASARFNLKTEPISDPCAKPATIGCQVTRGIACLSNQLDQ